MDRNALNLMLGMSLIGGVVREGSALDFTFDLLRILFLWSLGILEVTSAVESVYFGLCVEDSAET